MKKEVKKLFPITILIVVVTLFINTGYLVYKYGHLNTGLTGLSIGTIRDAFINASEMSQISKIFFIVQWLIISIIVVYAFFQDKLSILKGEEVENVASYRSSNKNKTDLDIFYDILKSRKSLRISTISKSFDVSENIAMGWAKILESANLAKIEYPGFGEPKVVINEKKISAISNNFKKTEKQEEKNAEQTSKPEKIETGIDRAKRPISEQPEAEQKETTANITVNEKKVNNKEVDTKKSVVNSEVLDYLKKYLDDYPLTELKNKIIQAGYTEQDINIALAQFGKKKSKKAKRNGSR